MPVVRFKGNKLDPATINALVAGTLVNGSSPTAWWKKQSADFRNLFMGSVRTSMQNGESLTQAITRVTGGTIDGVTVPGIMNRTKKQAGALVSTAMSAVTNEAALKSFQANNDVIKAVTQLSTLDNRTSDICIAYSGQTWDLNTLEPIAGSSLPFNGGPPRHFNCRSRLRPVTKSFKELGLDRDEIPAGTRASMDGQVPADITFSQWLKTKPKTFQDKLLGPRRAELWRNDQITLTQLVDMRGNPMTISQIEMKLGLKPKPAFNPATNRMVNKPTKGEKLTPPASIFDDLPEPKTPAQVEQVVEKVPMQDILDFNSKVVKMIDQQDWFAAQKIVLEAGDVIPDSVKANATKRIADSKKAVEKKAAKVDAHAEKFLNQWVAGAKTESQFNDKLAQALLQAIDDGDKAFQNAVIKAGKKLRDENKAVWEAAKKKADDTAKAIIEDTALDSAPTESVFNTWLKNALSDTDDALVKERILAQAEELRAANKNRFAWNEAKEEAARGKFSTAMSLLDDASPEYTKIWAAQQLHTKVLAKLSDAIHKNLVKDFDEWKAFVKKTLSEEIGDAVNDDWIRRSVLNSKLFEKFEQQAVWKKSTNQIEELLLKGSPHNAEDLLNTIPDTIPGWQDLKSKVLTAKKELEETIKVQFGGKAKTFLKKEGFHPDTFDALQEDIFTYGKLRNGVFDELVENQLRQKAEFIELQIKEAVEHFTKINKQSKGFQAIADFVAGLPTEIRQHSALNQALKKQVNNAIKKAEAAKKDVKLNLFGKDIVADADEFNAFESIINDSLKDVHKKLGKKQLDAKLAEIKAKIAQAKGNDVTVTPFVKDATDYAAEMRKIFTTTSQQDDVFTVAQMFKANGNDQNARYKLFDLLSGKSAAEKRKIKEYIHSIANPKNLPNGRNWDEAVHEITALHSGNAKRTEIMKRIEKMTEGMDEGMKTNFTQTIITRTGDDAVKSLDDLGTVTQGELSPAAQRIREQKEKEGWPSEVPLTPQTAEDIAEGAKEWSGNYRWKQREEDVMRDAYSNFRKGDQRYGKESFGIDAEDWRKHFNDPKNKWEPYEADLIYQYTGSLYSDFNSPLWRGSTDARLMRGAAAMNKALDKMPKHTGVLYRGENFTSGGFNYAEAFYKPGETITARGFWSTATRQEASFAKPGSGKDVVIHIQSKGKNGSIIGPISQFGDTEMEVLYKAGSKFEVIKTEVKERGRFQRSLHVWLKEV